MPEPTPTPWIDDVNRRAATDLRAAAAELRGAAAEMADRLLALRAYDRSDVWQGAVADGSRLRRAEATRRLASPSSGALTSLVDAATRLDARAAAHEAAIPATPVAPRRCPPIEVLLERWEADGDCPD